ncbi:MAG: Type 1 glutamine amidotransferase-like domain-containing protein [Candidatus Limnocylindrales bacterium]
MHGAIALHGGGEFLPGDERFLGAILELAPRVDGRVRIAIVPTAAARGRPAVAGSHGVEAFERVAENAGIRLEAMVVPVVDTASADDGSLAQRLMAATLIHLPGGDPDLIPTVLPGSAAWAAMRRANEDGAVLAGASAGAMALADWTWTSGGGMPGLGLVPGIVVAPHIDAASWSRSVQRFGGGVPGHLAVLGLGERTGVIIPAEGGRPWRVVGEGEVRWLSFEAREAGHDPIVARDGDVLEA